jgi:hypothetical protein
LTGTEFSRDPAVADNKSFGSASAGRTHGTGYPRSVEIAASTAAAAAPFSSGPARLFGVRLASSRRFFSLDRPRLPRTGHGLFVVTDAAAGAARLRERSSGTDRDGENAAKGNSDLNGVWHQHYFQ